MKRIISLSNECQMSTQKKLHNVSYVAQSDTMLELATCWGVRCRSALIVCVNCGITSQRNFRITEQLIRQCSLTKGGNVYHAQKEIMNPNHEKKNTRP